MGDSSDNTGALSAIFWALVWGLVGYGIYGTATGVAMLALYSMLTGMTIVLGIIPIIGVYFTFLANGYIKNWILTKIAMSWAIPVIGGVSLIGSFIITIVILVLIIKR